MKTPMQELIDELNQQIDLLIQKQFEVERRLEDIRWQSVYDGMIKSLGDVESMLKTRYLKKEKEVIMDAFNEQPDMYGGDYDFEYYYNEKFNTKDK